MGLLQHPPVSPGPPAVPAAFPVTTMSFPGYLNIGSSVLLVIYAFVGWESALVPAGEVRNPERDMPLALFWAPD